MNDVATSIYALDHIQSLDEPEALDHLDQTVEDVFLSSAPERAIDALFRVFERFPEIDSHGVFWGILHGLERLPHYEYRLLESVIKQPMEFNLNMINRLLNSGITIVGNVNLLILLSEIAADTRYSDTARSQAQHFITWQHTRCSV